MRFQPAGARTVDEASVSWMPDAGVSDGAGGLDDSLGPGGAVGLVGPPLGVGSPFASPGSSSPPQPAADVTSTAVRAAAAACRRVRVTWSSWSGRGRGEPGQPPITVARRSGHPGGGHTRANGPATGADESGPGGVCLGGPGVAVSYPN